MCNISTFTSFHIFPGSFSLYWVLDKAGRFSPVGFFIVEIWPVSCGLVRFCRQGCKVLLSLMGGVIHLYWFIIPPISVKSTVQPVENQCSFISAGREAGGNGQ